MSPDLPIDRAIRTRDKLLLILSERSIASDWVEDEVTTAYEEERRRGVVVLFPNVWTMQGESSPAEATAAEAEKARRRGRPSRPNVRHIEAAARLGARLLLRDAALKQRRGRSSAHHRTGGMSSLDRAPISLSRVRPGSRPMRTC